MLQLHHTPRPPKRLVILGASGFVGRHVAALSKEKGVETICPSSREVDLCQPGAHERLAAMLRSDDTVIFASAIVKGSKSTSDNTMLNVEMARQLALAVQKTPVAHLLYLSSDAVYPFHTGLTSEKTPPSPSILYGVMHLTRELTLQAEAPAPLAILRLTALYGEGDAHQAYGPNRFLTEAKTRNTITLFGSGAEMRDHLHVQDAAALIWEVVLHGATGILNVASGHSLSFLEVANIIARHTGARIQTSPQHQPITHRHNDVTQRIRLFPKYSSRPFSEVVAGMRCRNNA